MNKGIYYKDGVYLFIENKEFDDNDEIENCILNLYFLYDYTFLFGGRVKLSHYGLAIDGISIQRVNVKSKIVIDSLPPSLIVSHLNAIEVNGVDAFLENYKKSIEFIYTELKDLNEEAQTLLSSENDETEIKNLLTKIKQIRDLLFSVLIILFSLYSYMSAGLENEKVISVTQSVIDSPA